MTLTAPTVQIVDDDPSFLTATSRLLRASGFAVKTFSSASEFLAQLDTDAPGCVVADLQMPGMNGLDLQSALARSRNPVPILFLTGHGDIPSSVVAMRSGAEDFLEKRAPKEKLLDAVRRALARDAQEREERNPAAGVTRTLRHAHQTGVRSTRPRRSGQAQQADRWRSWHPRAHGKAAPHGNHEKITRAIRRGTHAPDRRGGHLHRVRTNLPQRAVVGTTAYAYSAHREFR